MIFKKKKIIETEETEEKEYTLQEILDITSQANLKKEIKLATDRKNYYKLLNREIAAAARQGHNKILTYSADDVYSFITLEFLREIQQVYDKKGFKTEYVQPLEEYPLHAWVRISWEID